METDRAFGQIRQSQGLYLEQAAALLRITPAYLRRLERGRFPLSLPLAERMCHLYGVSLNELTRPTRQGLPS